MTRMLSCTVPLRISAKVFWIFHDLLFHRLRIHPAAHLARIDRKKQQTFLMINFSFPFQIIDVYCYEQTPLPVHIKSQFIPINTELKIKPHQLC
jgi:hypothetical protein